MDPISTAMGIGRALNPGVQGGGWLGSMVRDREANREYERQKEFAQMGIQWRVADAKAAGVHPVFALSGGGAAYAPQAVSVGGRGSGRDYGLASQNIARAVQSVLSPEDRAAASLDLAIKAEQLRGLKIDNDNKPGGRVGHAAQVGPGMPSQIPGDMFAGDWATTKPAERISHDLEAPSVTASAASPFWEKFTIDDRGNTIWLPSGGKGTATESLESLSESWPLMYGVLSENMRRDPEMIYKLRHLWPGGEMAADVARWLEEKMQEALNLKKHLASRARGSQDIARRWWQMYRSNEAKKHGLK